MVKIRFQRWGTKKRPFYRLVVIPSTASPSGKAIEKLGSYNPLDAKAQMTVNGERVQYWLMKGAQLSKTVQSLLLKQGVIVKENKKNETYQLAKKSKENNEK